MKGTKIKETTGNAMVPVWFETRGFHSATDALKGIGEIECVM